LRRHRLPQDRAPSVGDTPALSARGEGWGEVKRRKRKESAPKRTLPSHYALKYVAAVELAAGLGRAPLSAGAVPACDRHRVLELPSFPALRTGAHAGGPVRAVDHPRVSAFRCKVLLVSQLCVPPRDTLHAAYLLSCVARSARKASPLGLNTVAGDEGCPSDCIARECGTSIRASARWQTAG